MTSISDLSQDLVEDILSRVPMTSLGATRSTCKLWNTLSKDPSFKHCGKAAKEIMVIMMYDFKACLMSVNLHNHKDLVDQFIKPIGKLKQVEICEVFQCDGLLLCVTCEPNNLRLVVWNPYSGQTRWIQPRKDYCTSGRDIYGMGYDRNNTHKILRVSYWLGHRGYNEGQLQSLHGWRGCTLQRSGSRRIFMSATYVLSLCSKFDADPVRLRYLQEAKENEEIISLLL